MFISNIYAMIMIRMISGIFILSFSVQTNTLPRGLRSRVDNAFPGYSPSFRYLMNIAAACALVAVPCGARVPSPMPSMILFIVIQQSGS